MQYSGNLRGKKSNHEPIIASNFPVEKIPRVAREDIARLANEALAWASAQDVEAGLTAYRNLPTNAKGALPLRHLAALALAGDVERLQYYRECFERGDRLDFVLYVTTEMIDRALTLAKEERQTIDNMTDQI